MAAMSAGTSLLFAVLGGILSEKAGVIHLRNGRDYAHWGGNVLYRLYFNRKPVSHTDYFSTRFWCTGAYSFISLYHIKGQSNCERISHHLIRYGTKCVFREIGSRCCLTCFDSKSTFALYRIDPIYWGYFF